MSQARRVALGLVLAAAWSASARADEVPFRRVELGGNLGLWSPMDDADDYADASPGLRLHGHYWITPMVAVGGAFDWVFVNEDGDQGDVTYYGFGVSGLLTTPHPAKVKPFGELGIERYTLDAEGVDAESDIGFRLAGGATVELSPGLALIGDLAYSTVNIDYGLVSVDVAALILEAGLSVRL
jgi:hypothetical protein